MNSFLRTISNHSEFARYFVLPKTVEEYRKLITFRFLLFIKLYLNVEKMWKFGYEGTRCASRQMGKKKFWSFKLLIMLKI